MKKINVFVLGLVALGTLASCAKAYIREETADRLAHPVWMVERDIPAGMFTLSAYERMHERFAPATVYIEGDGLLKDNFNIDSKNPTPRNPVALHLATKDKSENVVYLARPCQYKGADSCPEDYWGAARFSPEVLASYNIALNEIKRRYDIESLHLVGFDGGGTIAALLAAQRDDVLTLQTVAANLDHSVYSREHEIAPLSNSLNPVDFVEKLRDIPQVHYFGGQDKVTSPANLHSYLQAIGPSNCVQYHFIQEAEHEKGWVEKWPGFLAATPTCRGPAQSMDFDYDALPEPVYVSPDSPEKP